MATKKSAKKSAKKSTKVTASALRFRIDWIKDPMPDLRKVLDRTAIQRLDALKKEFGVKVGAIIKSGQR
ncbi:MAG: hypothetical protein ABJC10_08680 [Acidobacteriota bacterium]